MNKRKKYNTAILPGSLPDRVRRLEAILVADAIAVCKGNMSEAARMLGINRTTLLYKRKVLGSLIGVLPAAVEGEK